MNTRLNFAHWGSWDTVIYGPRITVMIDLFCMGSVSFKKRDASGKTFFPTVGVEMKT